MIGCMYYYSMMRAHVRALARLKKLAVRRDGSTKRKIDAWYVHSGRSKNGRVATQATKEDRRLAQPRRPPSCCGRCISQVPVVGGLMLVPPWGATGMEYPEEDVGLLCGQGVGKKNWLAACRAKDQLQHHIYVKPTGEYKKS